ncbi:hypothetical protein [Streptomyces olivaceus]|uniref:hypothetical protein n=1 Tax=Streptomyces olivaceus TaxID=47716 RepID=UPI00188568F9|nr:hypothetical protein [Streptomyces olivaceus]
MTTPTDVERALVPALIVGVACYVLLRWAAVPLLTHLETGMEYAVNVMIVGLLLPEYCWTRAQRRVSGHAAPLAYIYGDAVCAVASAGHRCVSTVLSALREAVGRLGHRGALWGGLLGAGALLWSGLP